MPQPAPYSITTPRQQTHSPMSSMFFLVIYGHVIAGNDTIAQKGAKRSPFLTTRWEGMPPQFY